MLKNNKITKLKILKNKKYNKKNNIKSLVMHFFTLKFIIRKFKLKLFLLY